MNIIDAAKAMKEGKSVRSELVGDRLSTGKREVIGVYDDGFFYPLQFDLDTLLVTDYEVVDE